MKLKIIKPNWDINWWFNTHMGEEVEISDISYYRNGSNYELPMVETFDELQKYKDIYGENLHIHIRRNVYPHSFEIPLESTNFVSLLRKIKIQAIKKASN